MGKSSGAGSPLATGAMFFGAGFGIASTFSRMPGIRDQLGVSPDQLAFALVFLGIGSLLGLPFAGRFVERYSSRTVSLVATAVFLGGCALLPLSRSLFEFGAMLLIEGVAMNVQGHLVEERRVKVFMPYWHGTFSIGAVSGALCGWLCVWFGLPLGWQLPTVSIVLSGVMGLATTHYLQDRIPRSCVGTGPFRGAVVSGPRTLPLSKSVTGQERRLALEPVKICWASSSLRRRLVGQSFENRPGYFSFKEAGLI
jgi:MFS family permease